MSEPRELHCYECVPIAYARVRDALSGDAIGIFQRATLTATSRAEALLASLHVGIGALQVGTSVVIDVGSMKETRSAVGETSARLELTWKAVHGAGWFPSMDATLSLYPLSSRETELDLHGKYRPPLGVVGQTADALVGHRIAEASVHRFLQEVAARLRAELTEASH